MNWRTMPRAKGALRPRGTMNKTEEAYAQHLKLLEHAGEVAWFAYEGMKLRLANNTFFTPDFIVMLANGEIEVHEVKGRSGESYWCEEDAKVKVKVAASLFPFRFAIVWPAKGGGWSSEQMSNDVQAAA